MNKTNLGKVVGDSAFEDWQKRNPGKTWEEFMKAIQGPGVKEFRYKEKTETGSLIYDVILQGDIVSGTIEIPPGAAGADFLTLEFVRFDDEGNTIVRSKNSKGQYGDEIIIKRGKRGYTGGIVGLPDGEPLPPTTDRYGTIIEYQGSEIPEGWALCNGGTLEARKYPHLIGRLPSVCEPIEVRYKFTDNSSATSSGSGGNASIWNRSIVCGGDTFSSTYYSRNWEDEGFNAGLFYSTRTSKYYYNNSNVIYRNATYPDISLREIKGWLATLEIKSSRRYMYLKAIAIDGHNLEYGGLLPDDEGRTADYNKNLHPDIYFNIEYIDEDSGDWRLGVQLHNKTDFIKSTLLDNMYIAEIKTTFKTKKIRISIDPKSRPHYPYPSDSEPFSGYYFLGRVQTYIDDIPNRDMTVLKLPNLKDTSGRYKLVYIGQPLEITEPTIYSYSKDNLFNGEVPLSLAVNNELPNYTEGITMTEPQPSRMGYTNKYNNNTDTWELVRTHENQEGYYYDVNGDLKYILKPYNWFKWDFENHEWVDDIDLKERIKSELLDRYVSLEVKKEKMIDLKIDISKIENEILSIKNELDEIKDSF